MTKFLKPFSVIFIFSFFVFGFSKTLIAQEMAGQPDAMDMRYQQISQEAQRNKELLEIWKDHVRTLTKERDEAYKEIETLKAVVSPYRKRRLSPLPLRWPMMAAARSLFKTLRRRFRISKRKMQN